MNIISKAMQFATSKHQGQLDDSGLPYIMHPNQVATLISDVVNFHDENLIAAAWLHDVIEDCGVSHKELIKEFGQDIADLVNEVTHEGSKDDKGYYFPRLTTQRGIMLKFADRLSNISRMGAWDENRKAQYLRRSQFWKTA